VRVSRTTPPAMKTNIHTRGCPAEQWRFTNQVPADGVTKMLPPHKHIEFIQQPHLCRHMLKGLRDREIIYPFVAE
jgi:hypothetical protein